MFKSRSFKKNLKKKDWRWKRTKQSLKSKQNQKQKTKKQIDLKTIESYAVEGFVKLKYLDEAGFSLWSPISYTYVKKGQQKEIKQTKRRGRRLNIIGIFEKDVSFEYGLVLGGIKTDVYIKIMDWQAEKAKKDFQEAGIITVIVQDNYTVHKSKKVKEKEKEWKEKGLEFFFLSAYSPELNKIEPEWHQLKTHELSGRMFEDEYDLAQAVIEGIEARAAKNNYVCQRFKFN